MSAAVDSESASEPDAECSSRRVIGAYEGSPAGPVLVVTGALHGNEPAGVHAFRRVLDRLNDARPEGFRGRLVGLIGHRRAFEDGSSRYFDADLNRMFRRGTLDRARELVALGEEMPEDLEALELVSALEDAFGVGEDGSPAREGVLLDLHTTSAPGPGFVAFEDSLPTRRIAKHFPLPLILGFEEELPGLLIDYVANRIGRPAVVIESGQHDDPAAIDGHEAAIWIALHATGMLRFDAVPHAIPPRETLSRASGGRAGLLFDVRRVVRVSETDCDLNGGLTSFDPVVAGETEVMREGGRLHTAAETGLLFMPNRQREKRVGDDAYFIVRRVGPVWLRLSAFCRRREWLHALIPPLLPGVRAEDGRPGTLLVEPRIALVLRRQVFHLLGYRLMRHGTEHHVPPVRRLSMAAGLLARGVGRALLAAVRLGRLPRAEPRHATDWVVRRRRLDQG